MNRIYISWQMISESLGDTEKNQKRTQILGVLAIGTLFFLRTLWLAPSLWIFFAIQDQGGSDCGLHSCNTQPSALPSEVLGQLSSSWSHFTAQA